MKRKLALGMLGGTGLSPAEQIQLIGNAGFDKIFLGFGKDEGFSKNLSAAKECGMEINGLHAPFLGCDKLWYPSEETESVIEGQIECLRACHDNGIPVSVHHVIIGFDLHEPTEAGLHSFDVIVREAEKLGVTVAFENTEGIEYFDAVMGRYKECGTVKFCIDTGHEICYTPGHDLMSAYGNRLAYTHINDNLGVCSDKITWLDDLHLLPFDGKVDFDRFARSVAACGYAGDLSFELTRQSKPGRCENDRYAEMKLEAYLSEAYSRAVRLSEMCDKYDSLSSEK